MKVLSILLTIALLGTMGWLVMDSRSEAKGAKNQLELLRRQQAGHAESSGNEQHLAAMENQLVAEQMSKRTSPPPPPTGIPGSMNIPAQTVPPPAPPPIAPRTGPPPGPALASALQAADAAPLPATPRQRLIASLPSIAEVREYKPEFGFVVITAGAGRKIESGKHFAVRRGNAIIGRITIDSVEDNSAVANVVPGSVPAGVSLEVADEIVQDLPPEQ